MKKIIILLIVLFSALENYGQFAFGPKIGYTTSKLSTDKDSISESIKNNFQIGLFMRLGKKLYLQPELYYATSGGTLKTAIGKQEVSLKNISIPALIGFKLLDAKIFNLRVLAGPVVNFIIDEKVKISDVVKYPLQESDFKNAAWGFDVGAGVDVLFLTLDVRYEIGLNNIIKLDSESLKSNLFVVSLGFKL
jgi:hypothetical protein